MIPLVFQTWPMYYSPDESNKTLSEMLRNSMPVLFTMMIPLLCGLALLFGTNFIVRMIGPGETADGPPASAQNLAWAGAFGVGVFYLLSWLPFAIVAIGATLLSSFSNREDSDRSFIQTKLVDNVWQWGIGSLLSAILIYVSLKALYGNQPFKWWNGGENDSGKADANDLSLL